jgi:hypothetical protein
MAGSLRPRRLGLQVYDIVINLNLQFNLDGLDLIRRRGILYLISATRYELDACVEPTRQRYWMALVAAPWAGLAGEVYPAP